MPYDADTYPEYSYEDPDGRQVTVPAAKVTPASRYQNEAMSADSAFSLQMAFGLAHDNEIPIVIKSHGKGWDAVIPLEFLRTIPGVAETLKRWSGQ